MGTTADESSDRTSFKKEITSEPIPAIRLIEQQNGNAVYQWAFHNSIIAAFIGWQGEIYASVVSSPYH